MRFRIHRWRRIVIALAVVAAIGIGVGVMLLPRPNDTREFEFSTPSGNARIRVDCFFPSDGNGAASRRPAVILAHGVEGASRFKWLHYHNARRIADETGYVVFFVHYFDPLPYDDLYRLDDDGELDMKQIESVIYESGDRRIWLDVMHDALRWTSRQPEVRPDRIGLIGYSLGGSLSLTCADESCRQSGQPKPRCVVVNYAARFRDRHLHETLCPSEFHHGQLDEVVKVEHAVKTVDELTALGVETQLYRYPGQQHVFQGADAEQSRKRSYAFLQKHLGPAPRTSRTESLGASKVPLIVP